MNTSKITAATKSRIEGFVSFYGGFKIYTKKLSDIYTGRSTNYAGIYDTDLFSINRNEAAIVAAGYSKLCKAIITLNMENKTVKSVIEILKAENEAKELAEVNEQTLYVARVAEADAWIVANQSIIADEATKVCKSFGVAAMPVSAMNSRMKQQLAWFLLKNFTNNTKTAIFHALK